MTSNPHIKAGSGAECSEVRTRDTVEAIVAEMRARLGRGTTETPLAAVVRAWADRLQSAHDAEVGALRREVSDARVNLPALGEKADRCERGMNDAFLRLAEMRQRAESAESRLREAERDARRWRYVREREMTVSRSKLVLSDASEKLDAAIDRAMEGEDG